MAVSIVIFGALALLAGIVIAVNPEITFGSLSEKLGLTKLYILSIAVRLVFGVSMIYQSDVSKFPFLVEIIGWFCCVIAIILTIMGQRNFSRLMSWALSFLKTYGRVFGVLTTAFGAFLIYAFV